MNNDLKDIHQFLDENKDFEFPQEIEYFLESYECSDTLNFAKSINDLYYHLLAYIYCRPKDQSIVLVKRIRYAYRNILLHLEYSTLVWEKFKDECPSMFETNLMYVNNDFHLSLDELSIQIRKEELLDIPAFCTFENIEKILRENAKNEIVKEYILNEAY